MRALLVLALFWAAPVCAESVVALRTIRPQQIITDHDVRLDQSTIQGAHQQLEDVLGQEAKYIIYPGRAIMKGSVGTPAIIERNQIVELIYSSGGLRIIAEGRALGRGATGDRIRVMNIGSRTTIFGEISPDGTIRVTK
ncbi:MAG: flagellar basal body P-ring formation chaperone FlgA [Pelagimonas sp.]|jgi:flagella basal body P-ring formation protein FlgA|nr:flagellar basal body P-ring formation chaperone FlgA [Pelagimonas sp.]